ncbi:MAG: hypothetical protein WC867_08330 [Candidatus Pacearchaeota archaeon]|jgi:hypothetical protein
MALEKKIHTKESLIQISGEFNSFYMSPEYLERIIKELDSKPVWSSQNFNQIPTYNDGVGICSNCRELYYIQPKKDICKSIKTPKGEIPGPFCYPCSISIGIKSLQ